MTNSQTPISHKATNQIDQSDKWGRLADDATVAKTIKALKANGIEAEVVENGQDAKKRTLEIIPQGAEVMTMSSVTLDDLGISKEINESGKYDAVRPRLYALNRETQAQEMRELGATPQWTIGSINAITQDGKLLIASNTGSQLSAYAYSSLNVIWIVGTQKIVKDLEDGIKRIYDYVLEKESARMKKAYGVPSNVSKLLIINKEINPKRLRVIFVKQKLGF